MRRWFFLRTITRTSAVSSPPRLPARVWAPLKIKATCPPTAVNVSEAAAGLVGEVMPGGNVLDCTSFIGFGLIGGGPEAGLIGDAGLVGVNYGTITNSFSFDSGSTAVSVTGLPNSHASPKTSSIALGGLVGVNFGTINGGGSGGLRRYRYRHGRLGRQHPERNRQLLPRRFRGRELRQNRQHHHGKGGRRQYTRNLSGFYHGRRHRPARCRRRWRHG